MAFWQQKPLPPGWEAKYDQRSGKYFFVNHTTKQTQWVDPRPAFYASQPQAAPAPAPAMAQHRRPPEQIAMQHIPKHKCKTCHVTEVPVAGNECRLCEVKKAQAQQREAALVRAREERDAAEKKRHNEGRIEQEQEKRRAQSPNAGCNRVVCMRALCPTAGPRYLHVQDNIKSQGKSLKRFAYTHAGIKIQLAQAQKQEAALVPARIRRGAADKKRQQETHPSLSERIKQAQEKRSAQSAERQVHQSGVHETQFGAGGEEEEEEEAAPVLSQAQKQQLVRELAASYTDVSDTVVDMVLESCQYKKTMAIGVLNSMSSQKVTTREDQKIITKGSTPRGSPAAARAATPEAARAATPEPAAPARSASPSTTQMGEEKKEEEKAGDKEDAKHSEPPTLTISEKIKLVNDLQEIYSDASRSVIDMVLETCQYNKAQAASVLDDMCKKKAPSQPSPQASSKPATSSPQKAKELTATQKQRVKDNLKKVFPQASETMITLALETTNYDQKKAEGVLRMLKDDNAKSPAKKTSTAAKSKTSKATTSKTSTSKASTSKASTSKTTGPAKTNTVAVVKEKKKPKTVQAARAKTPERTEYNSSHSTAAKGRDSSLAKGPNADLLIDNYVHEGGADVSMRHGPNPANVGGPSYESTKSSSIATGPQASMRNGPQSSLAKGSLYQGDRQN
ncbi:uncharacterized protein [Amphiura filiformis]|uniref:uncharacterized protein n=1 Tax=Amphiura filiformis TaxID=82378 RepID=UPI003B21B43C